MSKSKVENLKFVALAIPEILGVHKNFGQSLHTPTLARSLFSQICNALLFGWTLRIYRPNVKSATLPVPEIIAIEVLSGGCEPPILGKRKP